MEREIAISILVAHRNGWYEADPADLRLAREVLAGSGLDWVCNDDGTQALLVVKNNKEA